MTGTVHIANARMYAVAPGAKAAWEALFAWAAEEAGVPLRVIDHAFPAPLDELWAREDLGAAFMCGWPFARSATRPRLVAAPIPAHPRYGGQPVYVTDFVVRADSPFRRLEDTFGHRLAYTAEESHSGFNAVRHHLLRYRTTGRPKLYAEMVGPLVTPRRVVEAVRDGHAEVGPLDGFAHDLLRRHDPDFVSGLRVVATTDPAPIPALVASPGCSEEIIVRLRDALVTVGTRPELARLREDLCIARFVAVKPESYQLTDHWAQEAEAAGHRWPF